MNTEVVITAVELRRVLDARDAPVVLDVRARPPAQGGGCGLEEYRMGHVPGACYVDLDTELAGPATGDTSGRHPLPDLVGLQHVLRRCGLHRGQPVVVYDDAANTMAARAWWLLRWAGVSDVRLLDGAWPAWRDQGYEQARGDSPVVSPPGDVELSPGHLPVLDADDAAELARSGVLLDARAGERYRGEVEPLDPKAGHIPGARSAPLTDNLDANGRFIPVEALRRRFAALGADGSTPVGVYCGSGVTAAHLAAALALCGIPTALYPGSWSGWVADETRPVVTGPEPG